MGKKVRAVLFAVIFLLCNSAFANATLTKIGTAEFPGSDVGFNLIYDDAQHLVWLDYTKGMTIWANQLAWAAGLGFSPTDITLDPFYTTTIDWSTGWRLPSTDDSKADLDGPYVTLPGELEAEGWWGPDGSGNYNYRFGYNMVNSEMGHLYHESLGNLSGRATNGDWLVSGYGLINTVPFDNLQEETYWSGTMLTGSDHCVWNFRFSDGYQTNWDLESSFYALAVHPGEVSAVPEPATILLLGSGLIGLARLRRRMKK